MPMTHRSDTKNVLNPNEYLSKGGESSQNPMINDFEANKSSCGASILSNNLAI